VDTFWSLLRESVIVQGIMTLMLWGAIVYLAVTAQPIPELLATGGVAILGFWFGSKVTSASYAARKPE